MAAIVGNPPYVRIHDIPIIQRDYFKKKYFSAINQFDLYQLFYEKGLQLIKPHGFLGYITSNKFCVTQYGLNLRKYLINNFTIKNILDVSDISVFRSASTYPYVFIIENFKPHNAKTKIFKSDILNKYEFQYEIDQKELLVGDHLLLTINNNPLVTKILKKTESRRTQVILNV